MTKGSSPIRELKDFKDVLTGAAPEYELVHPSGGCGEARKYFNFKAAVLLVIAVVVVLAVVIPLAVVLPRRGGGSSLSVNGGGGVGGGVPPAAQPPATAVQQVSDLIKLACNGSLYQESCVQSLSAYPGGNNATLRDLVGIGLLIAKTQSEAGWQAATAFLTKGSSGGSPVLVDALKECAGHMVSSLDGLNTSIGIYSNLSTVAADAVGELEDMNQQLTAGETHIMTCSESLKEVAGSGIADQFLQLSDTAIRMISDALHLTNYLKGTLDEPDEEPADPPVPNRRLLSINPGLRSWSLLFPSVLRLPSAEVEEGAAENRLVSGGGGRAGSGHAFSQKVLPCVMNCFRADPVCGEDGVTYWCGVADAKCAGVEVAHSGFCNFQNGAGGKGSRAQQSLLLVHLLWLFFWVPVLLLGR